MRDDFFYKKEKNNIKKKLLFIFVFYEGTICTEFSLHSENSLCSENSYFAILVKFSLRIAKLSLLLLAAAC